MHTLTPEAQRSLALHSAVATQLHARPEWVACSRERIARWEAQGALHPEYAARWRAWLALPLEELCGDIVKSCGSGLNQAAAFSG